jgi:hypothetical protein
MTKSAVQSPRAICFSEFNAARLAGVRVPPPEERFEINITTEWSPGQIEAPVFFHRNDEGLIVRATTHNLS